MPCEAFLSFIFALYSFILIEKVAVSWQPFLSYNSMGLYFGTKAFIAIQLMR